MLIRMMISGARVARKVEFVDGRQFEDEVADPEDVLFADAKNAFSSDLQARTTGRALHLWLFGTPGAPGACGDGTSNERIYLHFDKASAADTAERDRINRLACLPWELIYSEAGTYLARSAGLFRVRAASQAKAEPCHWPTRIVAAGGATGGDPRLAVPQELHALRKLFVPWGRSINLEIIDLATNQALSRSITEDRPDILHFCGHATHVTGLEPSLQMASANLAGTDSFSTTQIGQLGKPAFQLVVLNACKSTVAAIQTPSAIWQESLAEMFLRNESRAVIAMQEDIQGEIAQYFIVQLYRNCLAGLALEEAVTQARDALDTNDPSWAMPVLTLAEMPPNTGYPMFAPAELEKSRVPLDSEGGHSPRFTANFQTQRRALTNWVADPARKASPKGPLALLLGEARSGKSHILKWVLSSVAHCRYQVRYIDFASFSQSGSTLVDLLRAIRDGSPARMAEGSIDCITQLRIPFEPIEAFDEFNSALNKLLGNDAPDPPSPSPIVDRYYPMPACQPPLVGTQTFNDHIAGLFQVALRKAAQHRPIFIALDIGGNSSRFERSEFSDFLTKIVIPEIKDWLRDPSANSAIRFAFCCRQDEWQGLLLRLAEWVRNEAPPGYKPPVVDFPTLPADADLVQYAAEMYWYCNTDDTVEKLAALIIANSKPVDRGIGLCEAITETLKMPVFKSAWDTINDPVSGVRFMR
jgi:hypothetical protein